MSSNKKTTPNCASANLDSLRDRNCILVCALKTKFTSGTHENKHVMRFTFRVCEYYSCKCWQGVLKLLIYNISVTDLAVFKCDR